MAIDYSKWDKIELSDDSDVEVHPNVDKKSFIRWKQQDIHQKREQRNHDIKTLEVQKKMYSDLNKRVDQILSDVEVAKLADYEYIQTYLAEHFDPTSKPDDIEDDGPTHNEMIEDLFTQLKSDLEKDSRDPSDGENVRRMILGHRVKIDSVLAQNLAKLENLYKERELHISSEDMHTGWDRSFLNKGDSSPTDTPATKSSSAAPVSTSSYTTPSAAVTSETESEPSKKVSVTESSKSSTEASSTTSNTQSKNSTSEEQELDDLWPETKLYAQLPITKTEEIKKFLKLNTHIINPHQKDALLMKAFDAQFAHDDKLTYQIIYLSTLLQYAYDLVDFKKTKNPQEIGIIVDQLISKMFENTRNKAFEAFKNEVDNTFNHIKTRCKILSEEQAAEGGDLEEIQLKNLDDDTKLVVNLPDSNSKDAEEVERCKVFAQLPKEMRDALKTESLDEVNNVFHGMPIAQAENILEIFDQCGVIGVQALIENEHDWKEIQNEYYEQNAESEQVNNEVQPKIHDLKINEPFESSADIVD